MAKCKTGQIYDVKLGKCVSLKKKDLKLRKSKPKTKGPGTLHTEKGRARYAGPGFEEYTRDVVFYGKKQTGTKKDLRNKR